jgi:D-alanyl-D-alanine carboxypeptidase/D-alanyl-D-alanine-endopeptidase (penicillin-binding protein 4)
MIDLVAGRLIVAAVVVASFACRSVSTHPASPRPAPPAQIQRDIDAILYQPALARGYWGVLVKSLKTGKTIYELNPQKLMMPASNLKIVTLAAAADRLGWDYAYITRFSSVGRIENGVLDGDVLAVGSGDPSFGAADGSASRAFDACAERLKALGVRTILGRIIGDDNAFDDEGLGFGWSWDDLPDDFAAAVSALQYNENAARLTVAPGPAPGDVAAFAVDPPDTGLTIDNRLLTGADGSAVSIEALRLPGSPRLELRGSVPIGSTPVTRVVSVDNPTLFLVKALRSGLIARGIALRLMKASQNLYAETLLKTIGAAGGTATGLAGRLLVQTTMQGWGIAPEWLILRDGSGLSRYDYVTPESLVRILEHVAGDDRLRGPFEAALPVAGRDGTLAARLRGTPAEGNVRAKTGSMANVRALSGYATTAAGEPVVFSIIANNFDAAPAVITEAIDAIVLRVLEWR